jgi:hypothetical protein
MYNICVLGAAMYNICVLGAVMYNICVLGAVMYNICVLGVLLQYTYIIHYCLLSHFHTTVVHSIQRYVIKFVSDLRQVGCFLRVSPLSSINKTDHHDIMYTICVLGAVMYNICVLGAVMYNICVLGAVMYTIIIHYCS